MTLATKTATKTMKSGDGKGRTSAGQTTAAPPTLYQQAPHPYAPRQVTRKLATTPTPSS